VRQNRYSPLDLVTTTERAGTDGCTDDAKAMERKRLILKKATTTTTITITIMIRRKRIMMVTLTHMLLTDPRKKRKHVT